MRTRLVEQKENYRSTTHRGMSENDTSVGAVWLIEKGAGRFLGFPPPPHCFQPYSAPSYSSTIVHIARSLCTTHPHLHRAAPWESYALCIHAAVPSIHALNLCLQHDAVFPGFGKVPGLLQATVVTHCDHTGHGFCFFFYGEGFILWERLPTSGTHLELFNERLSLPRLFTPSPP